MRNRMRQAFGDDQPFDDDQISSEGIPTGKSVTSGINNDGTVTEHHEKQWQGCWCPPELFRLLERGRVTGKEMILLLIIGNFVRHGHSPRGCYASNTYLAKLMNLKSAESLRRMMHRLKKRGLVRQVSFDGRKRYLDTKFSHVKKWSKNDD